MARNQSCRFGRSGKLTLTTPPPPHQTEKEREDAQKSYNHRDSGSPVLPRFGIHRVGLDVDGTVVRICEVPVLGACRCGC